MPKFCLALITYCLLFSACNFPPILQSQPPPPPPPPKIEWKELVSDEGRFSVLFPGIPKQSLREVDTPNGKAKSPKFDVFLPDGIFSVRYGDLPFEPNVNPNDLKSYYDSIRSDTLKAQPATLISERDVWINGKLGRELVVELDGTYSMYRFILNGKRIYQANTVVKISRKDDPTAQAMSNKFLDSFQIMEK